MINEYDGIDEFFEQIRAKLENRRMQPVVIEIFCILYLISS